MSSIRNYTKETEDLITQAAWRVYEKERQRHLEEVRAKDAGTRAEHGTKYRYSIGCRCRACKKAHADYQREYRRKKRENNPRPPRPEPKGRGREIKPHMHGTLTGYSYGCRCDRCREEHTYRRPKRGVEHGTLSGYQKHRCRCTRCTRAYQEKYRGYRKKYYEKMKARKMEEKYTAEEIQKRFPAIPEPQEEHEIKRDAGATEHHQETIEDVE